MADNVFEILLKYTGDFAKATEAKKELDAIKAKTTEVGKEAVKQEEAVTEATKKTVSVKKQLSDMVKGLAHQFPILGELGRLALNPIAATTAGITAAFFIWNKRMTELQRTIEGIDLSPLEKQRVKVDEIATAWANITKAIIDARAAYHSVDSESQRQTQRINDEFDAKLKMAKSDEERAVIEDERDRKLATQRSRTVANLKADAAAKMEQAKAIKVASAEEDDATQRQLDDNKAKAQKDLDERQARRSDLAEMEAGLPGQNPVQRQLAYAQFYTRYGNGSSIQDAYAMEDAGIAEGKDIIARADAFRALRPGRDALRKRRNELTSGAASSAAQAATMIEAEPDVARGVAANATNRWAAVGGGGNMIASAAAGADVVKAGGKATKDQQASINAAAKALGLIGQSNETIISILSRLNDNQDYMLNALKQLDSRTNNASQRP